MTTDYDAIILQLVDHGLHCDALYFENAEQIYFILRKIGHLESLLQLFRNGPIWDGDVISKSKRNDLIRWKLATRCCYKADDGYTAATYYGGTVARVEKRYIEDAYFRATKESRTL